MCTIKIIAIELISRNAGQCCMYILMHKEVYDKWTLSNVSVLRKRLIMKGFKVIILSFLLAESTLDNVLHVNPAMYM